MPEIPPNYVQYPRATRANDPYYRAPGVYIESIVDAWKLVKSDLATWIAATLVSLVLGGIIYVVMFIVILALLYQGNVDQMVAANGRNDLRPNLVSIPFGALTSIVQYGLMSLGVRKIRGESTGIGDIFYPWKKFAPLFVLLLAIQVLITIGLMLCLVPGVYAAGVTALAPLILIFGGDDPIDALMTSYNAMRGYGFHMFGLLLVLGIVILFGACACGVGLLFAIPVYAATIALHYHYFFPPVDDTQQVVDYSSPTA